MRADAPLCASCLGPARRVPCAERVFAVAGLTLQAGDVPASGRRRFLHAFAWLVVSGLAIACVAAVVVRPRVPEFLEPLFTSDFRVTLDESSRAVQAPRPVTISGRTTRPAKIDLVVDQMRVAMATTQGPDNTFQFRGVFVQPGALVRVRARVDTWYGGYHAETQIMNHGSYEPVQPRFLDVPTNVNEPAVTLRGRAAPFAQIAITSPDLATTSVWADRDGVFEREIALPKPGRYEFTVTAGLGGETALTSVPLSIVYDPRWRPPPVPPLARRLTVRADRGTGGVDVDVTLSRNDELARRMLAGELRVSSLVHAVFGDTALGTGEEGRLPLYVIFIAEAPSDVTVTDAHIVVHVRSTPRIMDYLLPAWRGSLTITFGRGFDLASDGDVLEVRSADFDIRAVTPPPGSYDRRVAHWQGAAGTSIPSVRLGLEAKALGTRSRIFGLLSLPVEALVPWYLRNLLSLAVMAVPVFAVFALTLTLRDGAGVARPFLVLTLLAPVMSLPSDVLGLAYSYHAMNFQGLPRWLQDYPRAHALLTGATLFCAIALRFAVYALPEGRRRREAASLLSAASIAAAFACIAYALSRILEVEPGLMLRTELVAILVLAPVLAWLAMRAIPVWRRPWRTITCLVVIAGAAVLTFPLERGILEFFDQPMTLWSQLQRFVSIVQQLVLYVLAWLVVSHLRDAMVDDDRYARLAVLIFATYLVGTTALVFWLPLPFLLALWLVPRHVLVPCRERQILDRLTPLVVRERRDVAARSLALVEAQQFRDALDKIDRKTISPTDFEKRKTEVDAYLAEREQQTTLEGGFTTQDVVLALGPHERPWDNSVIALKHGIVLVLPLLAVYVAAFLSKEVYLEDPLYFLSATTRLFGFATGWLMAAFFFGYFFAWIRGGSGLTKGVRVALTVIVCLLPARLANLGSLQGLLALVVIAGQTFLFFTILGVWAFDYKTSREVAGGRFEWRTFARLGDMRTIAASVSVLVTAIGLAGTTVLTNQLATVVSLVVRIAFPQADLPKLPK